MGWAWWKILDYYVISHFDYDDIDEDDFTALNKTGQRFWKNQ